MTIEFVVENAGCVSCGRVVCGALGALGLVEVLAIDEDADVVSVRLQQARNVGVEDVETLLEAVSAGAGHAYRVRPGSWTPIARQ